MKQIALQKLLSLVLSLTLWN